MFQKYTFITKKEKIDQLQRMCASEGFIFNISHDPSPGIKIIEVQISGIADQAFFEFIHRLGFLGI